MKIVYDQIAVTSLERSPEGAKLEPEEQVAERQIGVQPEVTMLPLDPTKVEKPNFAAGVPVLGHMAAQVGYAMSAAELAGNIRTQCAYCAHHDVPGANAVFGYWARAIDVNGKANLDRMRAEILNAFTVQQGPEFTEREIDSILARQGICRALTEAHGSLVITSPEGGCVEGEVGPHGEDLSNCFKPADAAAERIGTAAYDAILRRAQGRA